MEGREPSWQWSISDDCSPLCERALYPRPRLNLRYAEASLIHRHLMLLGKAANAKLHHSVALAAFQCAHAAKEDVNCIIAAANMRLNLGTISLAAAIYSRVLSQATWELADTQRSHAERKHAEATAARTARARSAANARLALENEVEQLLFDHALAPEDEGEDEGHSLERLVRLLRRYGHAANEAGEITAAQQWFDCAWQFSRAPADLLSAANMRAKQLEGSSAAEALYLEVSASEDADVHQREVAARKLEQLYAARAAWAAGGEDEAATAEQQHLADEQQHMSEIGWLAATALRANPAAGVDSRPDECADACAKACR